MPSKNLSLSHIVISTVPLIIFVFVLIFCGVCERGNAQTNKIVPFLTLSPKKNMPVPTNSLPSLKDLGFSMDLHEWLQEDFFNNSLQKSLQEMLEMSAQMEQFFNDSFGTFMGNGLFDQQFDSSGAASEVNWSDEGTFYNVTVDIPDMENADVSVNLKEQTLTIKVKTKMEREKKGTHSIRNEQQHRHFNRTIVLPAPVKQNEMETTYKDGVLLIKIPKGNEKDEGKTIRVI